MAEIIVSVAQAESILDCTNDVSIMATASGVNLAGKFIPRTPAILPLTLQGETMGSVKEKIGIAREKNSFKKSKMIIS